MLKKELIFGITNLKKFKILQHVKNTDAVDIN